MQPRHKSHANEGERPPNRRRTKRLTLPRLALLGAAGIAVLMIWSPAFALPFFHVSGDSDGDHLTDAYEEAQNLQPSVYCSTSHGDIVANGGIGAEDYAAVRGAFFQEPPTNPMTDQNHNDVGDYLDIVVVLDLKYWDVADFCDSTTPSPIPPTGGGSTSGGVLNLAAPTSLNGSEGSVRAFLFTSTTADPLRGYYAIVYFDETIVQASTATSLFAGGTGCEPLVIDNADDQAGPDGHVIQRCRGEEVTYTGMLSTFDFNVVAAGDPAFCIKPFDGPGGAGVLRGTFTIGTDVAPQIQSLVGTCGGLADPALDSDGDGCANVEEWGPTPALGGRRDPTNPYDFYDVNATKKVDAVDIAHVRAHFDPINPTEPGEEIYDRSPGAAAWAPGPPDGVINAVDIALVRDENGHTCQAAP